MSFSRFVPALTLIAFFVHQPPTVRGYQIHDRVYPLNRTYYPIYQDLSLSFDYEGEVSKGKTKICLKHIHGASYDYIVLNQGENLEIHDMDIKLTCDKPKKFWKDIQYSTRREYLDIWRGELQIDLKLQNMAVFPEEIALFIDFKPKHKIMDFQKNGIYTIGIRHDVGVHFFPAFARESFPCFDDPYFRTNFSLKIDLEGYPFYQNRILSNVPPRANGLEYGSFVYRSGDLPYTLPSYLLSFAMLREQLFDIVLQINYFGLNISFYSNVESDSFHKLDHDLLESAVVFTFSYCESKFGYPYIYPKLDIIYTALARLGDSPIGLFEMINTVDTIEAIRFLICQIVRQWIGGNLGLTFWSELWLTEGISHFIETDIFRMFTENFLIDSDLFGNFQEGETLFIIHQRVVSDMLPSLMSKYREDMRTGSTAFYAQAGSMFAALNDGLNHKLLPCLGHVMRYEDHRAFDADELASSLSTCPYEPVSEKSISSYFKYYLFQDAFPVVHVSTTKNGDEIRLMFDDYCGFDYDMYVVQCRIDHSEISKHEEFPVLLVKFFAWNSSEIWHSIAFHPSKKRKMYTYKWPYHAGKLHPLLNLDRKSLFLVQYTADFYDEVFRYIEGKPTWEMSKEAHESGYVPMNFHYVFMDLFYLAYADHDALMKLYLARLVWNSRYLKLMNVYDIPEMDNFKQFIEICLKNDMVIWLKMLGKEKDIERLHRFLCIGSGQDENDPKCTFRSHYLTDDYVQCSIWSKTYYKTFFKGLYKFIR